MAEHSVTMYSGDYFCVSSNPVFLEKTFSETSVVWNITSLEERAKSGEVLMSPLFTCSDSYWQLILYPKGETKNSICAELYLKNGNRDSSNPHRKFTTYFKINVSSEHLEARYSKKYTFLPEAKSEKFYFTLVQDYFDGDEQIMRETNRLKISLSICVEEDGYPVAPLIKSTELRKDETKKPTSLSCSLNSLSSDFEELYHNSQSSDVTLKLGEVQFQAHKLVLSARSKVFAAMFEHEMLENRQNAVDLVQMEVETVQDMLRYIYCGKVRELSPEQALNLYVAADRYDLQELKAICREVILSDISTSNVCDITEVADLYNDESFMLSIKQFMLQNGKKIVKTEKWKEMLTKKPLLCGKMIEWIISG